MAEEAAADEAGALSPQRELARQESIKVMTARVKVDQLRRALATHVKRVMQACAAAIPLMSSSYVLPSH